ncbi:Rrf2 family transcriptional regulator [Natronorubrum halophilum]|uniref:Rrf2 family transcriptional regulator n=1 Tax=Natronorubrum halophilum TaxID=1702106 RepID=UPI000EF67EF0|nr:Rrf2 family transcriptional regulator [Natronorubrum halophilum]
MTQIELTPRQRTALTALLNHYQDTGSPVAAKTIAEETDRKPKSFRRQLVNLKELGLVEGVRGPNGGYKPTEGAYSVLEREAVDDPETGVLASEFERIDAIVDEIRFTNVHNPDKCRAQIRFQQSIRGFDDGDAVAIGVTTGTELLLAGVIDVIDTTTNVIIVDIAQLETPGNWEGGRSRPSPPV